MGKRKPYIGAAVVLSVAAAVAEISKGRYMKNALTDAYRIAVSNKLPVRDGTQQAIGGILVAMLIHKAANKARMNPGVKAFGIGVRAF